MSESVNTTLVENCENDELEEKCEKNAEKDSIVTEDKFVMSDPVSAYLSSISKYKVLSREEEHDLMVRVKAGDKQAREEMILQISAKHKGRMKKLSFFHTPFVRD